MPRDIVKEIFDRPKSSKRRTSALFTHYKSLTKIMLPSKRKHEIPSNIKPLPVAIDIGTSSVKIVRLGENEMGQLEIVCIDQEPYKISDGSDFSSSVKNALKNLKERNEMGSSCVSNLPAGDVQIYDITFPPMSEEELKSAIQYKVSHFKPFGLAKEDIIFRFKKWEISKDISETSQQRVVIACTPHEAVLRRVSILKDSGFHPVSAEIPQFSVIGLGRFYRLQDDKDEVRIWAHIGAEESFLTIERNRVLCFTRKIAVNSNQIAKAISKQCRVSEKEAENLKKNYGFMYWSDNKKGSSFPEYAAPSEKPKDKPESVYYALISLLENLVVDIEHSFKYFSYQIAQSRITRFNRVILTGGGANLKNLDTFLNVRLGVPVEHFNPLAVFKYPESVKSQAGESLNEPATFAVATALSIEEKIDKPQRTNFLPEETKGRFEPLMEALRHRPANVAAAGLIAAVLLLGIQIGKAAYYGERVSSMKEELKNSKLDISKFETQKIALAKEEGDLIHREEMLEAQLGFLKSGFRSPVELSAVLGSVASLLPEEIWVNELKYEEGKLSITGSTVDLALIARLIKSIKDSDEFIDADFSYTQKESDKDVYVFEIIGNIKV